DIDVAQRAALPESPGGGRRGADLLPHRRLELVGRDLAVPQPLPQGAQLGLGELAVGDQERGGLDGERHPPSLFIRASAMRSASSTDPTRAPTGLRLWPFPAIRRVGPSALVRSCSVWGSAGRP